MKLKSIIHLLPSPLAPPTAHCHPERSTGTPSCQGTSTAFPYTGAQTRGKRACAGNLAWVVTLVVTLVAIRYRSRMTTDVAKFERKRISPWNLLPDRIGGVTSQHLAPPGVIQCTRLQCGTVHQVRRSERSSWWLASTP